MVKYLLNNNIIHIKMLQQPLCANCYPVSSHLSVVLILVVGELVFLSSLVLLKWFRIFISYPGDTGAETQNPTPPFFLVVKLGISSHTCTYFLFPLFFSFCFNLSFIFVLLSRNHTMNQEHNLVSPGWDQHGVNELEI